MPKIPFDLDKNFGRQAQSVEKRGSRWTSPVLLTLSAVAFGYAVLHVLSYV